MAVTRDEIASVFGPVDDELDLDSGTARSLSLDAK